MAITNLVPVPNGQSASPSTNATPAYVLDWAREELGVCLDACASKPLGCDDGPAMVDVAFYFNDPCAFISQSVVPKIDQRRNVAACFLAFLARLREKTTKGILPITDAVHFYQARVKSFIKMANFTQMFAVARDDKSPPVKVKEAGGQGQGQGQKRDGRTAISHAELTDFFSAMIQSSKEVDDLVTPFVSKLVADAHRLPATEFHALWLPFLRGLVPVLVNNHIPLNTPYCQELFVALLQAYIETYAGHKPGTSRNLVRPRVGCACKPCESLDDFLSSPTEDVGRFALRKYTHMYLHRRLDAGRVDCTYETERWESPQTLVVTKTFRHIKQQHSDWAQRLKLAREQMQSFSRDDLEQLLRSKYRTIVSTTDLAKPPAAAEPAQTAGSARDSQPVAVAAGAKRKAP